MKYFFTKRHLFIRFAESIVVCLCSTWSLKRFGDSKVSTVCCLPHGGYSGGNTDLHSVHEEAGIYWNWDATLFYIWLFFLRSWPTGTRPIFPKFCCYAWIFVHTHYLSFSQHLSSVSCCVEISYSICGLPSTLICQHFSNLDQVSHCRLTPWHRFPDHTNVPTEIEQQTRPIGNSYNIDSTLLIRNH